MPLIPFSTLLATIEENPIEGAKVAQKRYDAGVRNGTYESSVSAGALYRALKHNPSLISAFYELPMWQSGTNKKVYKKNPALLNKHCHQFVYGARDGSEGKRAEDHASATQRFYEDESKPLDHVLSTLKKVGFDGLKKAQSAPKANLQLKKTGAPESKQSEAEDHVQVATSRTRIIGKRAKLAANARANDAPVAKPSAPDSTNTREHALEIQQDAGSALQTLEDLAQSGLFIAMCSEDLAGIDDLDDDDLLTVIAKKIKHPASKYVRFEAVKIIP